VKVRRSSKDEKDKHTRRRRERSSSFPLALDTSNAALGSVTRERDVVTPGGHTLVVPPADLQATFENVLATLSRDGLDVLSKESVMDLYRTTYEWMVFDPNRQISLPSGPDSKISRKIWPQGSRIDTRKGQNKADVKSSARSLREVGEEYESTVASSVISSALEEDGMTTDKGSIVYGGALGPSVYHPQPLQANVYSYLQSQPTAPTVQYQNVAMRPNLQAQVQQSRVPPTIPEDGSEHTKPYRPQEKVVPRYSIIGAAAPPERVVETPDVSGPEKPKRKTTRKVRVGATTRVNNTREDGEAVAWVD